MTEIERKKQEFIRSYELINPHLNLLEVIISETGSKECNREYVWYERQDVQTYDIKNVSSTITTNECTEYGPNSTTLKRRQENKESSQEKRGH